jgi:hypothetical protein
MKKPLALLITLAILIGGTYTAYTYWQNNKTKSPTTANNQTNKTSDPTEGGKYLVIKEWGVRFEVPEEYHGDLYYFIYSENIAPQDSNNITIGSKKLESTDTRCGAGKDSDGTYRMGIAGVTRIRTGDPAPFNYESAASFGGRDYFTEPAQAACVSSSDRIEDLAKRRFAVNQSIDKTLELVK